MLTTMKHRTFLPFLKNPFTFSTFPHRETYVSPQRNLRFPNQKHTVPHGETYVSLMGNIKISPINRDLHKDISVSS